jgi:PilZ domain-containing protein
MQERRKSIRKRTFLGGRLAFQARYATLDCTIRNLSDTGARIAVDGSAILPDEFDFTLTRNDRAYRARLVWRDADAAGLELCSAETSGIVTLDWARKLRGRERENANLRRRVSDLSSG